MLSNPPNNLKTGCGSGFLPAVYSRDKPHKNAQKNQLKIRCLAQNSYPQTVALIQHKICTQNRDTLPRQTFHPPCIMSQTWRAGKIASR